MGEDKTLRHRGMSLNVRFKILSSLDNCKYFYSLMNLQPGTPSTSSRAPANWANQPCATPPSSVEHNNICRRNPRQPPRPIKQSELQCFQMKGIAASTAATCMESEVESGDERWEWVWSKWEPNRCPFSIFEFWIKVTYSCTSCTVCTYSVIQCEGGH